MLTNGIMTLHPNMRIDMELLKRSLIFQDKSYVFNSEYFIAAQRYEQLGNTKQADELEMLIESQIIHCAEGISGNLVNVPTEEDLVTIFDMYRKAECTLFESSGLKANREQDNFITFVGNNISNEKLGFLKKLEGVKEHYLSRVLSHKISKTFYPLSGSSVVTGVLPKVDTLRLEVLNYPTIDTSMTWRRLWEFKQDKETQAHLVRFNRLLKRLLSTMHSTKEIIEEIEYLLQEYTRHVELAEMRYKASKRVIFFKCPDSILEALTDPILGMVKFTSKIFDNVLNIKKEHIEFMQAKHNAPEKEVSLLYEIQKLK